MPAEQPAIGAGADGTPFVAYGSLFVHRGLQRTPGDASFQALLGAPAPACCAYSPDVAVRSRPGPCGWAGTPARRRGRACGWRRSTRAPARRPAPRSRCPGRRPCSVGGPTARSRSGGGHHGRGGAPDVHVAAAGATRCATARWCGRSARGRRSCSAGASGPLPRSGASRSPARPTPPLGRMDHRHHHVAADPCAQVEPAATRWGAETAVRAPAGSVDALSIDASAIGGALDVVGRFSFTAPNRGGARTSSGSRRP